MRIININYFYLKLLPPPGPPRIKALSRMNTNVLSRSTGGSFLIRFIPIVEIFTRSAEEHVLTVGFY